MPLVYNSSEKTKGEEMLLKIVIAAIVLMVTVILVAHALGKRKRERRKAEVAEIMRKHREQTWHSANPATETYLEKTGPRYSEHFDGKQIAAVNTLQKSTPSIFRTDAIGEYYKRHPVDTKSPGLLGSGWLPSSNTKSRNAVQPKTESTSSCIGKSYRIEYTDSSGNKTSRVITVEKLKRLYGFTFVEAFCHLRNEMRTFALERIRTYIVDTETGELVDPEILSWHSVKQLIPAEKAKQSLFLQISEKTEGWLVHSPYDDISTKQKRKALGLTPYNQHRDAYCAAIDKTVESGYKVLCLFLGGKYKVPKGAKNQHLIEIYPIDLSREIGVAKAEWLHNLCNS